MFLSRKKMSSGTVKCTCACAPAVWWRFGATCGESVENVAFTDMFIDTALMDVLQAVSEQLLHTLGLLNAVYHVMRKDGILFYGAICEIVDDYTKSSDPYGVLMVDDMNDAIGGSLGRTVVKALEKRSRRSHMKKLPSKTDVCVKPVLDFRSLVELKAIVAYLAHVAYTADLRWRSVAFISITAVSHAVFHALFEILVMANSLDSDRSRHFARCHDGQLH